MAADILALENQIAHLEKCMDILTIKYEKGHAFKEELKYSIHTDPQFMDMLEDILESIDSEHIFLGETQHNKKSQLHKLLAERSESEEDQISQKNNNKA